MWVIAGASQAQRISSPAVQEGLFYLERAGDVCSLPLGEARGRTSAAAERSRAGVRVSQGDCGFPSLPFLPSRGVFTSSFCHLESPLQPQDTL